MVQEVVQIVELQAAEVAAHLAELSELLVDAVESGGSVSFMLPFSQADAAAYWQALIAAIADRQVVLLVALDQGRVVGTVHLDMQTSPNQPHRAEVAKLLVHRSARRQGIGRMLMQQIEGAAQRHNRTLLTLDTLTDSGAERLYLSLGYCLAGMIPNYAYLPTGQLRGTSIFYKHLEAEPPESR